MPEELYQFDKFILEEELLERKKPQDINTSNK